MKTVRFYKNFDCICKIYTEGKNQEDDEIGSANPRAQVMHLLIVHSSHNSTKIDVRFLQERAYELISAIKAILYKTMLFVHV